MFLEILTMAIGALFFGAGFAIFFLGRYDLITDYTPQKGARYAKRVGLIEMLSGALTVAGGVGGLFVEAEAFSWFYLFGCIALVLFLLSLNEKSSK